MAGPRRIGLANAIAPDGTLFGMLASPLRQRPPVLIMALADTAVAALYLMYLAGP